MLATPRSLGHSFNPLSVFWCTDLDGDLVAIIAEVHNTYGGRHCYLVRPDGVGQAMADKALYVSPFFPVDGAYELQFSALGAPLDVRIALRRPNEHGSRRGGVPRRAHGRCAGAGAIGARVGAAPRRCELVGERPDPATGHPPLAARAAHVPTTCPAPGHEQLRSDLMAMRAEEFGHGELEQLEPALEYRAGPWRTVGPAPRVPVHAAICRSLFLRVAHNLPVRIVLPDGRAVDRATNPTRCCECTATTSSTVSATTD